MRKYACCWITALCFWVMFAACHKNGVGSNTGPGVAFSATSVQLVVPKGCGGEIWVKNTGNIAFKIAVKDDATHAGILDFAGDSTEVQPGDSVRINITVKAGMLDKAQLLTGDILVLKAYSIANNISIEQDIQVTIETVASLTGNWAGTWNGVAVPKQDTCICQVTNPADSVHGTWGIQLNKIDALRQKILSGTITWQGNDVYYTYTYFASGKVASSTPHPFVAAETFVLDSTNTTISPDFCNGFFLVITDNRPNDYRLMLQAEFDAVSGKVYTTGNGFLTHPYDLNHSYNYSAGMVAGARQ